MLKPRDMSEKVNAQNHIQLTKEEIEEILNPTPPEEWVVMVEGLPGECITNSSGLNIEYGGLQRVIPGIKYGKTKFKIFKTLEDAKKASKEILDSIQPKKGNRITSTKTFDIKFGGDREIIREAAKKIESRIEEDLTDNFVSRFMDSLKPETKEEGGDE